MSDKHHMPRQSDDEEEDLEILRLAALKSLHSKKDPTTSTAYPTGVGQQRGKHIPSPPYTVGHLHPGTSYINNDSVKRCYYASEHSLQSKAPLQNLADTFDASQRLEKLDVNEPYVPQNVTSASSTSHLMSGGNGWNPEPSNISNGYVPYIPHKGNENIGVGVSNVQLSPRSLAFVAENNVILMRRKGENSSPNHLRSPCMSPWSPPYRAPIISYRSPSPLYRQSPGRWSITPPPKSNSPSPPPRNRLHHYSHRRSMSRSLPPSRGRSPVNRRRSLSRSPPPLPPSRHTSPYRCSPRSPKYPIHKRVKSRSPPSRPRNKSPTRRLSRSPTTLPRHKTKSKSPLNITGRRRSSPAPRHFNKNRSSPIHQKRSSSHGHDIVEIRHAHKPRSSPNTMMLNNVGRSRSRSPVRKMPRRSRDRNMPLSQPTRRRSPYHNGRRRPEGSANGYRNRGRKRSASPMSIRRKFSRSRSPEKIRRDENRLRKTERNIRKTDESAKATKVKEDERNVDNNIEVVPSVGENQVQGLTQINEENQNVKINKIESYQSSLEAITEDSQDKMDMETESEIKQNMFLEGLIEENSSDESDDDGIDLFPSDESESENEGRFKLSTSKKERDESVPILSFTKLRESSVPDLVKDLKDVGSSSNNKGRENRDRDRGGYESRRRDDRLRKTDSNRNCRSDRRRLNGSHNVSRREYEESGRLDDKRRTDRPMFKATFQAVDNDSSKVGKNIDEKELNERKTTQSKRRFHVKDERDSPENEVLSEKLSSVVTSNAGGSSGGNSGTSGKKPIHLRLGAMTNTFKAPKKSSTWSSTDKVSLFLYLFKNLLSHPPSRILCCDYSILGFFAI